MAGGEKNGITKKTGAIQVSQRTHDKRYSKRKKALV